MSWFDDIGSVLLTGSRAAARNRQQQQQQPPVGQQQPFPQSDRSRTVENILGLTGAFVKSKSEADRADRNMAQGNAQVKARLLQDHTQFSARMASELEAADRAMNLNRAVSAANTSRLGETENFVTRNRILSHVLPKMQGGNFKPGDASVAATMGNRTSPFAGGIPPEALAALSEDATANAIAGRNRQLLNIDSRSPIADLGAMGLPPDAAEDLDGYRDRLVNGEMDAKTRLEDTIKQALLQDYQSITALPGVEADEQKKKEGFWRKIGKIASIAAPIIAAPFTGGASLAAIGAGSGASLAALNGGKGKDILLGAALGSTAGLGARKKPTTPASTAAATNRMRIVPPVGGY